VFGYSRMYVMFVTSSQGSLTGLFLTRARVSHDDDTLTQGQELSMQGPYKPFGIIPSKTLGTHDSDWEHVTVRLTVSLKLNDRPNFQI
jgi:hypothetical protein